MNEEKFEEFKKDYSLLIESGFVAVKQLDEIGAIRIFTATQALSPKNTAPKIGMGFIALNKMQIKEATKIYEEVVAVEPENHLAQAFLAICFLVTKGKLKKGQKLMQETLEKSDDPTIKNLAVLALEWAIRDLSKPSSPYFQKEEEPEEKSK